MRTFWAAVRDPQLLSQHPQAALLHRAQGPQQRQQGGFAGAGRASQQHDLPWLQGKANVEENLLAQGSLAEIVVYTFGFDHRLNGILGRSKGSLIEKRSQHRKLKISKLCVDNSLTT
jgi:hypothetical protein